MDICTYIMLSFDLQVKIDSQRLTETSSVIRKDLVKNVILTFVFKLLRTL